ncbi:MAG TPA: hypothetical protein DEF47_06150 [Herpetosiphon sp.]|uniref:Uncharacterized protein n=1 Tax=Herpetosiphon aurantiacus (strain ATCC 23779 / DSM 785 / 114-95) TaxID=316274 RepID=A9B2W6_HERA2|nr:hypothetical protein [Herpetosiphon sp.]ABX06029.1 hypothetical protein Haur_3393 [Herpetosiphon aurantiacus DSM 785]HBW49465.1 hypothetical protein [Herpetosiphon sp.]
MKYWKQTLFGLIGLLGTSLALFDSPFWQNMELRTGLRMLIDSLPGVMLMVASYIHARYHPRYRQDRQPIKQTGGLWPDWLPDYAFKTLAGLALVQGLLIISLSIVS